MYGAFIHAFAHVALCVCGSRRLNDKFPHRYRLATAARMGTEWAHLEQVMAACVWLHRCPSACGCFFLQVSATGSSETRIIRLFTRPVLTSASSLPKPGNRQNEKMPWGLNSFAPHHEKSVSSCECSIAALCTPTRKSASTCKVAAQQAYFFSA